MGRKRKTEAGLPPRCYIRNGKVSFIPKSGGRITLHELGKNPPLDQIWKAYSEIQEDHQPTTLRAMAKALANSVRYKKYAPRTIRDHERYLESLLKVFAKSDFSQCTPGHINNWLEARAKVAQEQANKELSFLRIVLAHAVSTNVLKQNPAALVPKIPLSDDEKRAKRQAKRDSYVTDRVYDSQYARVPVRLKVAMELLFCLGVRKGDLLRIKHSDIQYFPGKHPKTNDNGVKIYGYIDIDEGKGINEYSREITERVHAALQLSQKIPGTRSMMYLICNEKGKQYTPDGFATVWQYWRMKAPKAERFGIHRLRAKAITDWEGNRRDKWMFSRHKTESMVAEYDDSIPKAPSH